MLELVDEAEQQIEGLRKRAESLISDREHMVRTLRTISELGHDLNIGDTDRAEMLANVSRLQKRLGTVNVEVTTIRDEAQEKALQTVDREIATLIDIVQCDFKKGQMLLQRYINSCSEGNGHQDTRFEKLVLACCLEDQKTIEKRLRVLQERTAALEDDSPDDTTSPLSTKKLDDTKKTDT